MSESANWRRKTGEALFRRWKCILWRTGGASFPGSDAFSARWWRGGWSPYSRDIRFGPGSILRRERRGEGLLVPVAAQPSWLFALSLFPMPGERSSKRKRPVRAGGEFTGTVFGKFFCTSRRCQRDSRSAGERSGGTSRRGIASVLGRSLGLRPEKVRRSCPWGRQPQSQRIQTPLAAVLFSLEDGGDYAQVLARWCWPRQLLAMLRCSWEMIRCFRSAISIGPSGEFGIYRYSGCWRFVSRRLRSALLDASGLSAFTEKDLVVPTRGGRIDVGVMGWFVPQLSAWATNTWVKLSRQHGVEVDDPVLCTEVFP